MPASKTAKLRSRRAAITLDMAAVDARLEALGFATKNAKAERLGCNRTTLLRWRKGDHGVSLDAANRVAIALGLSIDAVISRRQS